MENSLPKATIILTNQCNLGCTYCFVKKNNRARLSKEQTRTFIEWFIGQPNEHDYKKLNFFGGEPFLEFEILKDAILFFKARNTSKRSIIDTIPTNGTVLTQQMLNFIKQEQLRVSFSLDGDRVGNFARQFVNGKECFDDVWRNLKKFTDFIGAPPLIKMTVLPSNVRDLYANVKFLIDNGFYNVWPNPGAFTAQWEKEDVRHFIDQYEKVLNLYLKKILKKEPVSLIPADDILARSRKGHLKEHDFFCGFGEEPILAFDGNIYACDSFLLENDDLTQKMRVGRVVDHRVDIDMNKMRALRGYNVMEEYQLRNKDHELAYLFRRRPCFALNADGQRIKKEYSENILEMHIKMFELTLNLFAKVSC